MSAEIKELSPKQVWGYFYELTQIPRPTGHVEAVSRHIVAFGKQLGLETLQDKVGNVLIRKPATPGMEDRKTVTLQAHLDMVPQKNSSVSHNFLTDPIDAWIDGDWVKARETTLGADNGIGASLAMAVLADNSLKHGPVEALFTVDEEEGMVGAFGLKPGFLKGDILLNCDSEKEGELFVGLNRRHAPLIQQIKREMKTDQIPAVYDFIGNAGFIPKDHWVHDEAAGGGRILGEACHFVDLIQYLDGSHLEDLTVTAASNNAYPMNDNVLITLRFASGAIGNIVYSSMGSKKYPKEQLRVLSNGSVYEMDNFIRLKKYGSTKSVKEKLKQDKGIHAEYEYICKVLRGQEKNTVIADAFRGQELLIKAMQKVKES